VAQTDLPLVGHTACQAEGLQALAQRVGNMGCIAVSPAQGRGGAHDISPRRILKADTLDSFDGSVNVQTDILADLLCFLQRGNAVFMEKCQNIVSAHFDVFKSNCHDSPPLTQHGGQ